MNNKTCCFTGHRPEKLPWGIHENSYKCIKLKELIHQQIEYLIKMFDVTHFISGMAKGVDMYAAEIVLQLKKAYPVTLECAVPFEEQAAKWREKDRQRYFEIAAQSDQKTILQQWFSRDCYRKRNKYMVDQSKYMLAIWDGTSSGTGSTVDYARKKGRYIFIIDPIRMTVTSNMMVYK